MYADTNTHTILINTSPEYNVLRLIDSSCSALPLAYPIFALLCPTRKTQDFACYSRLTCVVNVWGAIVPVASTKRPQDVREECEKIGENHRVETCESLQRVAQRARQTSHEKSRETSDLSASAESRLRGLYRVSPSPRRYGLLPSAPQRPLAASLELEKGLKKSIHSYASQFV